MGIVLLHPVYLAVNHMTKGLQGALGMEGIHFAYAHKAPEVHQREPGVAVVTIDPYVPNE